MRYTTAILFTLALALVMSAAGPGPNAAAQQTSLSDEISAAADEYNVPKELLLAMGYVNTRWEMPPPETSDYQSGDLEGRGDYGVMALAQNPSRDTLGRAATLTGLSEEQLKTDRASNVRGAAALLADIQGPQKPSDLNGWYDTVSKYGDTSLYAEQVFETLKSGASTTTSSGETLDLAAQPGVEPQRSITAQATGDYSGSTWYGNNGSNYTSSNRETSYDINKIVIHDTEGSWSSAINWFRDPRSCCSAHYTIRSSDGFIGQSVREKDIAYHAGNWSYNTTSIGIEHEGYASTPKYFTDTMYRSSARLSAYLAKKYRIPIDRSHIIGHVEVPGATHTDPGKYWDWPKYMNYIKAYAGTSTTTSSSNTQVVDNQNTARFLASGNWTKSSWNTQRHWKSYRYTKPHNTYDTAKFKIRIPKRDKYQIYAWWPDDPGYSARASFKIRTASGPVIRTVSQRTNGGKWVSLGTFDMIAGDEYKIELSSKSTSAGYIIADAVKVVRR